MSNWEQLVGSLNAGKSLGKPAPHKPLLVLMLLARAARGGSNELRFGEIYEPLKRLLRSFGPPTRMQQPELPFWHLQGDGFWRIASASALPLGKNGKRPTLGTLKKANPKGFVPEKLWSQLTRSVIARLAKSILGSFWPVSLHGAILQEVGLGLEGSDPCVVRDPEFRYGVLRAYEGQCTFCGYDGRLEGQVFGLDAAHIRWHAYGGPDSVNNGLALCSLHHVAFDRGAMSLTPDLRIAVSQDVRGSSGLARQALVKLSGKKASLPQSDEYLPSGRFIKWHQKNVFRGPARKSP